VYEYFPGQFAGNDAGKDEGAFHAPRSVVRTLVTSHFRSGRHMAALD